MRCSLIGKGRCHSHGQVVESHIILFFFFRMDMVVVSGKSQKNVQAFILITPDAKQGIESLCKDGHRNPNSLYIFDKPNTLAPMDGCGAMRSITDICPGLQYPERIRSNKIRQYLAVFARVSFDYQIQF